MISHKHKCIFVHIPKAAGTSIERVFMKDLGLNMDNRHSLLLGASTNKSLGPRRVSHLTVMEYLSHHYISQELFEQYFKFTFVRNPYDRLFSTYKMLGYSDYLSFDGFVKYKLKDLLLSKDYGFFLIPAYDYLFDNNKLMVDFVGKFEDLKEDFNSVLNVTGLNHLSLEHHNKSSIANKNLLDLIKTLSKLLRNINMVDKISLDKPKLELSKQAKEIVIKIYEKDFDAFDYKK